MMKLIQNIDVYAPQHLGKKDVLTINDKIVKIKDAGSISADGFLSEAEMINGEGLLLTPGFIDSHVHVLGGGGEGGFANRTPEATLEKAVELGCGAVCFEGNIDFYGKSGFRQASEYGIRYHGLPEGDDASFFLCKEFVPGYLDGITGEYTTPEGYLVDEREAEEFDKQFPYTELFQEAIVYGHLQQNFMMR